MKKLILVASLLAMTVAAAVDAAAQNAADSTNPRQQRGQGNQGGQPKQNPQTNNQQNQQRRVQSPPQPPPQGRHVPQPPQMSIYRGPKVRWEGGHGTPPQGAWQHARSHDWCLDKARRLHDFERLAASDGRVSKDERRIIENLRYDLQRSCGGGRWHPDRGWYY